MGSILNAQRRRLPAAVVILAIAGVFPVAAASASPAFQMPFPCNETWYVATYPSHLPSTLATDWNFRPNDGDSDRGKPVVAGVAGLAYPRTDASYGNYVDVEIAGGWTARYAHLDSFSVTAGQPVDPSTKVGTVGRTGNSTAAHLHYEQRLNGVAQHVSFGGALLEYVDYPQSLPYTSANCLPDTSTSYVALGDSYSSGEGNPSYEQGTDDLLDNMCHRSAAAFPEEVAKSSADLALQVENIACSGARTEHIDAVERYEPPQTSRLAEVADGGDVRAVSITVGGNDLGFSSLMLKCVFFDCDTDSAKQRLGAKLQTLRTNLRRVYASIQSVLNERAPGARLFALGYPRLFAETRRCGVFNEFKLSERQWLNDAVEQVNAVVRATADDSGAIFVDVTHAFAGHELCYGISGTAGTYVNKPVNLPNYKSGLHPNASGHQALASKLLESMKANLAPYVPTYAVGQGAVNQSAFVAAHAAAGGTTALGRPVNPVHAWKGGCVQDFVGGTAGKSAIMSFECSGPAYAVTGGHWAYLENRWGSEAAAIIGYPYNNAHPWGPGLVQDFAHGRLGHSILMQRTETSSVFNVFGGIKDKYVELGGAEGRLGYPVSDEYDWEGEKRQDFDTASIIWNEGEGARLLQTTTPDRRAITSYDEMRPGAPRWGEFHWAYQPFVARSNTITYLGVTVGHSGYTSGATLADRLRIRLCSDPGCSTTFADASPQILNYGNTEVDIGDIGVVKGATYFVRWDRPSAVRWDTFWWGGTGSGRQPISSSDQMQMVVKGYDQ